jgi:hypothetical protein
MPHITREARFALCQRTTSAISSAIVLGTKAEAQRATADALSGQDRRLTTIAQLITPRKFFFAANRIERSDLRDATADCYL